MILLLLFEGLRVCRKCVREGGPGEFSTDGGLY